MPEPKKQIEKPNTRLVEARENLKKAQRLYQKLLSQKPAAGQTGAELAAKHKALQEALAAKRLAAAEVEAAERNIPAPKPEEAVETNILKEKV